jgi:hypothetical protein
MQIIDILKWTDIVLYAAAGLMGIVLLFRNVAFAWKWVALAGIVWAVSSLLQMTLPGFYSYAIADIQIIKILSRLLMGFSLFIAMVSVR